MPIHLNPHTYMHTRIYTTAMPINKANHVQIHTYIHTFIHAYIRTYILHLCQNPIPYSPHIYIYANFLENNIKFEDKVFIYTPSLSWAGGDKRSILSGVQLFFNSKLVLFSIRPLILPKLINPVCSMICQYFGVEEKDSFISQRVLARSETQTATSRIFTSFIKSISNVDNLIAKRASFQRWCHDKIRKYFWIWRLLIYNCKCC